MTFVTLELIVHSYYTTSTSFAPSPAFTTQICILSSASSLATRSSPQQSQQRMTYFLFGMTLSMAAVSLTIRQV